jgi:hypothetical protein
VTADTLSQPNQTQPNPAPGSSSLLVARVLVDASNRIAAIAVMVLFASVGVVYHKQDATRSAWPVLLIALGLTALSLGLVITARPLARKRGVPSHTGTPRFAIALTAIILLALLADMTGHLALLSNAIRHGTTAWAATE